SGINAAAKELGMKRTTVQRAVKIASMSDEAKQAAEQAGLADNQAALERIARAEDQVGEVQRIREEREAKVAKPLPPLPPPPEADDDEEEPEYSQAECSQWAALSHAFYAASARVQ